MTATAGEDDGKLKVFPDRARLVEAAFRIGHSRNTNLISKTDLSGRDYVLICTLKRTEDETDAEFDHDLDNFAREFFGILSDSQTAERNARDEMVDIYRSMADDESGEDIYLSDGVWLSSDGSMDDRGR